MKHITVGPFSSDYTLIWWEMVKTSQAGMRKSSIVTEDEQDWLRKEARQHPLIFTIHN